jgi:tetratricopeptide (TPR) repeat protein
MDEARRSAADEDLAQARAALDRGELHHAAGHLAGAIAHAPTLPETHELLGRFAARPDGGLELFPLGRHAFVGTLVARAHLLAAAGRPEDGLPLLAAATGHTPGLDWAGVPWVSDPGLGLRLEPDRLARIVMQLCTAVRDPAPQPERDGLRPYLTVVRHAVTVHPGHAMLLGAGSALARRLGETAIAVDWAARGAAAHPSKLGEIWLGYAYRSAGRIGEALAALRRAVAHDPEDLSVYADIAATLADHGDLDDALRWAEQALLRDPGFDCAVHTAQRLRYLADGDLAHLVRLADFQRDHPDDTHEHTDLAECCRRVPWLGHIPAAPDLVPPLRRHPDAAGGPAAGSVARLHRVAQPAWPHPPAAYDAAVELVLVEPGDLLAMIARPPAPPDGEPCATLAEHDPAMWDRTAQVWACLGLLHHRADEPWPGSTRRRLLVELAGGGADWVTEAALFALVTYSWVEPASRADVAGLVSERLAEIAAQPRTGLAWSVAQLALATPGLDPAAQELAAAVVRAERRPFVPRRRVGPGGLLRWLRR